MNQEKRSVSPQETSGVIREVNNCRVCGSPDLRKYLDPGMLLLANNLATIADQRVAVHGKPSSITAVQKLRRLLHRLKAIPY